MNETTEDRAARIVAEAGQMIGEIQRQLDAGDDFFRANGIKREKVQPALDAVMGQKEKDDLAKIIQADQEAIQREVDEATARANFAIPPTSRAPKKPRMMA